jgi:hypothetical protein
LSRTAKHIHDRVGIACCLDISFRLDGVITCDGAKMRLDRAGGRTCSAMCVAFVLEGHGICSADLLRGLDLGCSRLKLRISKERAESRREAGTKRPGADEQVDTKTAEKRRKLRRESEFLYHLGCH